MSIWDGYCDDLDVGWDDLDVIQLYSGYICDWMDAYYLTASEDSWRFNVKGICRHYYEAVNTICFGTPYGSIPYRIPALFRHLVAGAVDMDGILNAMLQAEYEQLQKFIGIEDAYRSAIWDQPFNAEFYAALARGFMP